MTDYTPARLLEGGSSNEDELASADLLGELPDADASDIAVARIWRKVAPQPKVQRAPLPRWLLIGAPSFGAAVLIIGVTAGLARVAPSEIVIASGGVYFSRPAEPWAVGETGQLLTAGERVRSDGSGNAVLGISDIATVLVAPKTDIAAEKLSGGTVLRLSKGSLTARVKKRPAGQPFIVETDRYTVRVVGTLFTVTQSAEGNIAVSVREGTVQVLEHEDVIARVTAGELWKSENPSAPKGTDETSDSTVILLEESLAHRPAQALAARFEALTHPVELPGTSLLDAMARAPVASPVEASDRKGLTRLPSAATLPRVAGEAQSKKTENLGAVREKAVVNANEVKALPDAVAAQPANSPFVIPLPVAERTLPAIVPAVIAPQPRPVQATPAVVPMVAPATAHADQGSYARAQALQAAGDFRGAVTELERAADENSVRSESALFQLGRISMTKLDDSTKALAAFQKYERRYPEGTFSPEVDLSILEIDLKHASAAESDAQASRYLQRHPENEHAQEVRLIRGDLRRERGEFADAISDYRLIRRPALADDALYSVAYCQRKLGDRNAAAQTLNDYLAQFPGGKHRDEAKHALAERQAEMQPEKK